MNKLTTAKRIAVVAAPGGGQQHPLHGAHDQRV
jgi:hypothetical protein